MNWEGEQRTEWVVHRKRFMQREIHTGDSRDWKEEIGLSPC